MTRRRDSPGFVFKDEYFLWIPKINRFQLFSQKKQPNLVVFKNFNRKSVVFKNLNRKSVVFLNYKKIWLFKRMDSIFITHKEMEESILIIYILIIALDVYYPKSKLFNNNAFNTSINYDKLKNCNEKLINELYPS